MKPRQQIVLALSMFVSCAVGTAAEQARTKSFCKEPPLFSTAPKETASLQTIDRFGPVGMGIELHQPAFVMKIKNIEAGFRHEGEAFFAWLKANGIAPDRFFIICGDRHWKYHSRHASGFEELNCGAHNRENSRLGRNPGDPKSTDPQAEVLQFYTDNPASGGFMRVALTPGAAGRPATLEFSQHDDQEKVLHRHEVR